MIVPLERPEPAAEEPLGGGDAAQHVEEHADGVVGDVGGVDGAGVGDGDAAARALGEVDVVNARGRADEAADGVEEAPPPMTTAARGGSGSAEASSSTRKRWCIALPQGAPGRRMKSTAGTGSTRCTPPAPAIADCLAASC